MEENKDYINIIYTKNLNKQNFNSILNVPVDANVNIKTILNIDSFIFDEKIECANGKAVISGKIGLKVLYIDTDNITNTLTDSQPFSETIVDNSITADCYLNLTNSGIVNTVLSSDGNLKIGCDISFSPVLYINLGMNSNANAYENMITKKSQLNTTTISNFVNTSFEYTTTFETKDNINKVLCHDSYFTATGVTANDNYAIVDGKLFSTLVYETTVNDETVIKEIVDCFNVKTDVEIPNITKENLLDLTFCLDKNAENIVTEIEDGNSIITVTNKIKVKGVVLKDISVDIVEDMYSVENELELNYTNREYVCNCNKKDVVENVSNEISLNKDEPAIDEVISNLHVCPEITNTYAKDGNLYVEGVVSSSFVYLDENREYKFKQLELPFVINTKCEQEKLYSNNISVSVLSCKVKAKRGTIIEIDYELNVSCCVYSTNEKEIVNNVTLGKSLDFSNYDYQIYIAKQNETLWDLSKRVKVYPDELNKYNKDLPSVFEGGEKVVIKR